MADGEIPTLGARERSALAARHYPLSQQRAGLSGEYVGVPPYCADCHEPWGEHGCSTRRALALLAHAEFEAGRAEDELRDVRETLGKIAAEHRFRADASKESIGRSHNLLAASIYVDARALRHGGATVIDGSLAELRAKFTDWLDEETRDPREEAAKAFNASLADQRRRGEHGA